MALTCLWKCRSRTATSLVATSAFLPSFTHSLVALTVGGIVSQLANYMKKVIGFKAVTQHAEGGAGWYMLTSAHLILHYVIDQPHCFARDTTSARSFITTFPSASLQ